MNKEESQSIVQLFVPAPSPTAITQKRKTISSASLIGVRNRMMDNEPTNPSDNTRLPRIKSMTTATIGASITRDVIKESS